MDEAKQQGDRVIIFSHIPVYVEVSAPWNDKPFAEAPLTLALAPYEAALDPMLL